MHLDRPRQNGKGDGGDEGDEGDEGNEGGQSEATLIKHCILEENFLHGAGVCCLVLESLVTS